MKLAYPAMPSARREMHLLADIIAPNSLAESEQVQRLLAIEKSKMRIVYLAADERFAIANESEFRKMYNIDNFILSIGRIEPRKNQLNLIIGKSKLGVPLLGSSVAYSLNGGFEYIF